MPTANIEIFSDGANKRENEKSTSQQQPRNSHAHKLTYKVNDKRKIKIKRNSIGRKVCEWNDENRPTATTSATVETPKSWTTTFVEMNRCRKLQQILKSGYLSWKSDLEIRLCAKWKRLRCSFFSQSCSISLYLSLLSLHASPPHTVFVTVFMLLLTCCLSVPFSSFFSAFFTSCWAFFSRRWAWKRWKFNNVSVEFRCLCLRLFLWSNDARSNDAILMIPRVGVAEISAIHFHTHSRMNATGIVEINILCRFYLCSVIFFPSRVHWSRKKFFHSRSEVKEFNNELGRMENENHFIRMSKNIFVFFFFSSFIS